MLHIFKNPKKKRFSYNSKSVKEKEKERQNYKCFKELNCKIILWSKNHHFPFRERKRVVIRIRRWTREWDTWSDGWWFTTRSRAVVNSDRVERPLLLNETNGGSSGDPQSERNVGDAQWWVTTKKYLGRGRICL